MRALIATAFLCACSGAANAREGPYDRHQVIRVTARSGAELNTITQLADDVWSCSYGLGPVDIQLAPEKVADFNRWADAQGVPHEVLIPDVQALIDLEAAQMERARRERNVDWFATYHTLTEIYARLDQFAANYPQLASTFIAGQSLEGRPIKGIRFSAPDQPGNARSQRPQVMFEGTQHAREWIATCESMWVVDRLLETYATDPSVASLLSSMEIIVVPVVNADGYAYTWTSGARLWRKNRRLNANGTYGVDLNRNWGYQWGGQGAATAPGDETYRGTAAFSEPETQVMRDFISAQPRLKGFIDFHSYGQLVLSPWGYTSALCPDDPLFEALNADMAAGIASVHGTAFFYGPSYVAIYPASGVVPDWTYGAKGVLGWTIEMRDTGRYGFVLPPDQIVPACEETFMAVRSLTQFVQRRLMMSLPGGPPVRAEAGVDGAAQLLVMNGLEAIAPGSVTLYARSDPQATFAASPMVAAGNNMYTGHFAAPPCGATVEIRFSARTAGGITSWYPDASGAITFPASSTYQTFSDDMETDRGWVVGAPGDNATGGRWERGDPQGTSAQPEDDASPAGTMCWITGAAAGANSNANDVDGGVTTLTSPLFSAIPPPATHVVETRLSYAKWYSNNTGTSPYADTFITQISNDGGATWVLLEESGVNTTQWQRMVWSLDSIIAPTAAMKLRFIARDLGNASTVEAGVDDVLLEVFGCPRSADINQDGGVDGADVEAFFAAWQAALPAGDFNEDGGVDGADVEEFFLAWERG